MEEEAHTIAEEAQTLFMFRSRQYFKFWFKPREQVIRIMAGNGFGPE